MNVTRIDDYRDRDGRKVPAWEVRWRARDGHDRRKRFTGKNAKARADVFRAELELELVDGRAADPRRGTIRFGAWVNTWATDYRPARATTTMNRDDAYLASQVLPEWAGYRLCDIRKTDVQAWVNTMHRTGYPDRGRGTPLKTSSIDKIVGVLCKVLDAAVDAELIPANPARNIKMPRKDRGEARFLSPVEVVMLEDAMPDDLSKLMVAFLACTGLRIGELCGLRWRNVDLEAGHVNVVEGLIEDRGRVVVGDLKTPAARRIVPYLTREVCARLYEHRQAENADADGFVFGDGFTPARPSNIRSRPWKEGIAGAHLADPQPTPHSLRHTAVSLWIDQGASPFDVARYAGHRDISTVHRIYGHLFELDKPNRRDMIGETMRAAREQRRHVIAITR